MTLERKVKCAIEFLPHFQSAVGEKMGFSTVGPEHHIAVLNKNDGRQPASS